MRSQANRSVRSFPPAGEVAADSHFLNRQGSGFVSKDLVRSPPERSAPGESGQCRFSIFRVDEVSVTSTRFVGGDWRWRLCDPDGAILVERGGYRKEAHCRRAVALLQAGAARATVV